MYCYDMDGKLIWQKDFGVQMRMKMGFGEGMAPVLAGNKLILVFDHEGESFMAVLDKTTGREIWRVSTRREDQLGRAARRAASRAARRWSWRPRRRCAATTSRPAS